jgi:phage shock protein A
MKSIALSGSNGGFHTVLVCLCWFGAVMPFGGAFLVAPPNSVAFKKPVLPLMSDQGSMTARPPTALHANLVDRFIRVARGNLSTILSRFEDPEKVMDQALSDMQNDITKIRQTYAEATAGQRRLLAQKTQHESIADDWYRRATLALKSNNEGLAREALARREQALQKAAAVQQQVDGQAGNLDKLYEGMKALEEQIQKAHAHKSELAARAKMAKSTVWVNDMLSGLSGTTSMDAFRRMEDKVAALEASAEISAEILNNALMSPTPERLSASSIELEFKRLESSDAVDREFEKLRARMLTSAVDDKKEETFRISADREAVRSF